jgi:hypothetical protein
MDSTLAPAVDEIPSAPPATWDDLACVRPLRIAAATLRHASRGDISATTVVSVVGADELPAFCASVAAIGAEYDLDVRVRARLGSYAVRFSRR